jgi:hypothetical protein
LAGFRFARHDRLSNDPVMRNEAGYLPDDVAALKVMLLAHAAELAEIKDVRKSQDAELAKARSDLIEQRFESEKLKAQLAKLKRATFGRSSEKLGEQIDQLELKLAEIDGLLAEGNLPETRNLPRWRTPSSMSWTKPAEKLKSDSWC